MSSLKPKDGFRYFGMPLLWAQYICVKNKSPRDRWNQPDIAMVLMLARAEQVVWARSRQVLRLTRLCRKAMGFSEQEDDQCA
jgi:hypothetical protein